MISLFDYLFEIILEIRIIYYGDIFLWQEDYCEIILLEFFQ